MNYVTFHDISYAQGKYNMDTDPSPVVEIKMSGFYYGSKQPYLDVQASNNYTNAVRLNKIPILYHYAGGGDPVAEANYFINTACSPLAEGDIYELDYELTDDMGPPVDPDGWCRTFADKVKEITGVYPLLYTNTSTFLRYGKFPRTMEVCALMIADYRYTPDQDVPCGHPYVVHQFTDSPIDTNALFISLDTLKQYGHHAPVAESVPVPPVLPVPPVVPAEPPVPVPTPNPDPGTVVQPQTPPQPPTNGTAIDVVVNPPKPKPQLPPQPVQPPIVLPAKVNELNKAEGVAMKLGRYNKFFVGLAGAILTYLSLHYGSSTIVQDAVLIASVLGIYAIPNTPSTPSK